MLTILESLRTLVNLFLTICNLSLTYQLLVTDIPKMVGYDELLNSHLLLILCPSNPPYSNSELRTPNS